MGVELDKNLCGGGVVMNNFSNYTLSVLNVFLYTVGFPVHGYMQEISTLL